MSQRRYISDGLLLLISAVLFYLAGPNIFCKTGYAFTAWIFAVPFFFALDGKNTWHRLIYGIIFSLTAYLLILSWVANMNGFLFIFFSLLFAIQPVLFAGFFRVDHARPIRTFLFLPALWVLTEALRTWVTGGYAWTIGHSQTYVPVLIQIADLTGAYGISFAILLVNTCLFFALSEQKQKKTYSLIAAAVFGLVVIYGMIQFSVDEKTAAESFSVCTIQPDITSAEKFNPDLIDAVAEKHIALVELCAKNFDPDLIVWPETALTDDFLKDPALNKRISALSQKIRIPMLIGAALMFRDQNYNSAVLLDRDGKTKGFYHKSYLLPFNEYFPLALRQLEFFKRHFHINNHNFRSAVSDLVLPLIKNFGHTTSTSKKRYFGVAICSEEGYPLLLREEVKRGANFFVILLNNKWFNSDAAMMMHTQNGIMAAAAFKRPVVRATNSGLSCLIDQYGRIISPPRNAMRLNQKAIFYFLIDLKHQMTVYGKLGDVFIYFCIIMVTANFFREKKKGETEKRE